MGSTTLGWLVGWVYVYLVLCKWVSNGARALHAHSGWWCEGECGNEEQQMHVFGAISLALHAPTRGEYYPFSMDWLNRYDFSFRLILLRTNWQTDETTNEHTNTHVHKHTHTCNYRVSDSQSKLRVTVTSVQNLKDLDDSNPNSDLVPRGPEKFASDEIFRVIFVTLQSPAEYTSQHQQRVDSFLTLRPCYLPLHEPQNNLNHTDESPLHSRLVHKAVILIRLPLFGFGPTCSFYDKIVKHQFPQGGCDPNISHYRIHHMSNAGYGGSYITLLEQVLYNFAMTPEKIVIVPSGSNRDHSWLWNDRNRCPLN